MQETHIDQNKTNPHQSKRNKQTTEERNREYTHEKKERKRGGTHLKGIRR